MLFTQTKTADSVSRVRSSFHSLADITNSSKGHTGNSTKRREIHHLDRCVIEFDCDLFHEIKPILRSHQTGMVASYQLIEDFETAHADGKTNSVFNFSEEKKMFHVKNFDYTIHINSSPL